MASEMQERVMGALDRVYLAASATGRKASLEALADAAIGVCRDHFVGPTEMVGDPFPRHREDGSSLSADSGEVERLRGFLRYMDSQNDYAVPLAWRKEIARLLASHTPAPPPNADARVKLDRLADALVEDILSASDEEILAEMKEGAPPLAAGKAEMAEGRKLLEKAVSALDYFADAVFNDNGDMTVTGMPFDPDKHILAYQVRRRILSALATPPAQVEPPKGLDDIACAAWYAATNADLDGLDIEEKYTAVVKAVLDATAKAAPPTAQARLAAEEMRERCAQWIDDLRDDYVSEHGSYDPSTGATEFPGNGEEYVGELEEIAEAIRALPLPTSEPLGGEG